MSALVFNTKSDQLSTVNGFVYCWTHCPTGQYYIGIHKGLSDDGYIGSGKRFRNKWNSTNEEDWKRTILFEGNYYTECILLEAELVNDETLKDPLCLNLVSGGRTGEKLREFSRKKKVL